MSTPSGEPGPVALLTGWGRTAPSAARMHRVACVDEVAALVTGSGARGCLPRGLGRSYGDAAQSAGGDVLDLTALADMHLDAETGLLVAGAGCSIGAVLAASVPRGWFVPVTPGTRHVTLGGAVAADVHGKNHHVDGSIGRHVRWLDLVDGAGEVRRLQPDGGDAEAFWATVGGMGLTGVVTRVALAMRPVTSGRMLVDTSREPHLDAVMTRLREHDTFTYTVAWVDLLAGGRASGRGVVTSGEHAGPDCTGPGGTAASGALPRPARLGVPRLPVGLVGWASARAFNEAWFRRAPRRAHRQAQSFGSFFHPLDGVRDWNRLYGPRGLLQYQMVVPDGAEGVVEDAVRLLREAGTPSFLAVLKRLGPGNPAPLSFPRQGWTLAMDLPRRGGSLAGVLDRLDERVASVGGAVYLAKDARMRPDLLEAMYPRLGQWRSVRARLDPHGRFASDLSRRLGL